MHGTLSIISITCSCLQGCLIGTGCLLKVGRYYNASTNFGMHTGVTTGTIKEDDPLALIGEQLLYISATSLSRMVPIGEGKCKP